MPAEVTALRLHPSDSKANAVLVSEKLGWAVVEGFAVFSVQDHATQYVAKKRWWCADAAGAWVDVTVEKPAACVDGGMVLGRSLRARCAGKVWLGGV